MKMFNFLKFLSPLRRDHLDSMKIHTKDPKFQKVECHDVVKKTGGQNKSNSNSTYKFTCVKIEKEDPQMIILTERQKMVMINYINKSLYDYNQGLIHLDDLAIKNYKNIQNAVEGDGRIRKTSVDFVLRDMRDSYTREGYSQRITEQYDSDDIFEFRIK